MRRAAVALALGAWVLASCGGSDGGPTASVDPGPGESVTSTSPDTGRETTDRSASGEVPDTTTADHALSGGVQPDGFSTVMARITSADGEVCEVCLWLAASGEERSRGLMGVTDLGDAAGMAFVFEAPTAGSFYMFQTPTPLSIAWFAPGGAYVGSADMAPCLDTPAGACPRYSPGIGYDLAIEVFEGGLADLGIGAGSTAVLIPGTESPTCLTPARV